MARVATRPPFRDDFAVSGERGWTKATPGPGTAASRSLARTAGNTVQPLVRGHRPRATPDAPPSLASTAESVPAARTPAADRTA